VEDARALADLRRSLRLIGSEVILEGWAASFGQSLSPIPGLVLVTDWRVVFMDTSGRMMALPISKISITEVAPPCAVTFTVWYGRMALSFDTPSALRSVVGLMRQSSGWSSIEVNRMRLRNEPVVLPAVHRSEPGVANDVRDGGLPMVRALLLKSPEFA